MGILPMSFLFERDRVLDSPRYVISRIDEGGDKHRIFTCTSLSKGVFLIGRLRANHPKVKYELQFKS